jgi:hypothetical protein
MTLVHDRVRAHTAGEVLKAIDGNTDTSLERYVHATPSEIERRLEELDREWDTDRAIELEAAITGLVGIALSRFRPALLAVPAVVGSAVLLHAVSGWYPLLPVMRRLGLRTSREIERERYALKALRGDFNSLDSGNGAPRPPHAGGGAP